MESGRVMSRTEDQTKSRNETDSEAEGPGLVASIQKISVLKRVTGFYHDTKAELGKTTWPTRNEVWNFTAVVVIAVVFFGFYLWGIDRLIKVGFDYLEKVIK